jgi:hypothetical protein
MRYRKSLLTALLVAALAGGTAWADQLVLKNGREYSGKFVRADGNVVEFRILGRIESFKTTEVSQIVFKEPELVNPPSGASRTAAPDVQPVEPAAPVRETPPAVAEDRDVRTGPAPREIPPEAAGPTATLPAGTPITIRTTETIDTDRNRVGDIFDATLEEPLMLGSQTLAPRGAEVKGTIAYAKESGRVSGQSELILELSEIRVNGRTYPLRTSDYVEIGASQGKRTAAAAGGGAAIGAIIGVIAGGGKGAAVGAATGAAVGTGVQVLSRGQTLKVPAETVLEFRLQHALTLDVP